MSEEHVKVTTMEMYGFIASKYFIVQGADCKNMSSVTSRKDSVMQYYFVKKRMLLLYLA
jgi:hypothetical protein